MKKRLLLIICIISQFALSATGLADEKVPISLEEVIATALKNNPSLRQAQLDKSAAGWGMLGAVSEAFPHVSFNSSVLRSDDESVFRSNIMRDVILQEYGQYIDPEDFPPFLYKDMYSSSISVDQPIYNGGVEITALRIAGTRKKIIKLTLETQQRETILQATIAYYNLCRAYQAFLVQQNTLEVSNSYLNRFKRRQDLGLISEVDVLRWEVQAADEYAAFIEAENNLKLANLELGRVIGLSSEGWYYPSDLADFLGVSSGDPSAGIESPESLWERIQERSPDLEIARSSIALEKQNVWLASSNFQPKFNFNYTYAWQSDGDLALDGFESWTASISLSMPIFASFGNVAKIQEARIGVKKAKESVRDYENSLHIQLIAAYSDLQSAAARLNSAKRMSQQAEEVVAAQENRHELGMITMLELLDAKTTKLRAELNQINSLFDALIARERLVRIVGPMDR
ncbi:hypothetical protein CEE37_03590 [candidate division LCP-89 bacterium B3_LCP]|uniref:Transporter n=1 Tax=candidate division LCP-89 bacterium B3_LCP TaxID=2012998 RepID=A0A532V3F9_UNCL8|nr:MAG: hypothetical protein CEE37_03590 [candidate division LCP-89 bacterium B3_LCP]